mmetsp:Transcript_33402/g.69964  ORF Transcript_33402/g.69964 Transcript_33402/m.69964 type:complete len:310 (+) Transcript_33402:347-1276(+)
MQGGCSDRVAAAPRGQGGSVEDDGSRARGGSGAVRGRVAACPARVGTGRDGGRSELGKGKHDGGGGAGGALAGPPRPVSAADSQGAGAGPGGVRPLRRHGPGRAWPAERRTERHLFDGQGPPGHSQGAACHRKWPARPEAQHPRPRRAGAESAHGLGHPPHQPAQPQLLGQRAGPVGLAGRAGRRGAPGPHGAQRPGLVLAALRRRAVGPRAGRAPKGRRAYRPEGAAAGGAGVERGPEGRRRQERNRDGQRGRCATIARDLNDQAPAGQGGSPVGHRHRPRQQGDRGPVRCGGGRRDAALERADAHKD